MSCQTSVKGIRCPSTIRQKDLKVLSCPDAIGRLVEKVLKLQNGNGNGNGHSHIDEQAYDIKSENFENEPRPTAKFDNQYTDNDSYKNNDKVLPEDGLSEANAAKIVKCPDCGKEVEHEGGCVICRHCGFSKCG